MKIKNRKKKICAVFASAAVALCCGVGAGLSLSSANATQTERASQTRTPADLWNVGSGITAEANVESPKYATQGLYVDGYKDNKRFIRYRDVESNPEYLKTGVKITSASEREVAEYRNVIDIEGSVKEENLLTLIPMSSAPTKRTDFNGMKVYLRDAEDEDIYVCIDIYLYAATGITMFTVSSSDGGKGGYQYGSYHQNFRNYFECSEKYFYSSYRLAGVTTLDKWSPEWNYTFEDESRYVEGGVPEGEMYVKPISLSYDEKDKAVWLNGGKQCLFDLDDVDNIPTAKRFKGFTSNKIKLSVLTYDIVGENAQYMLYAVDGQGMNGESVADATTPYFTDAISNENLPLAGVNHEYKLFDIHAYDLVDGDVQPKVYVKKQVDSDDAFALVEGDTFTPTEQGNYVLRYVATDSSGNEKSIEYVITAKYAIPEVEVRIDTFEKDCRVGDRVYLPAWSAEGGSGTLTSKVEVSRLADGVSVEIQDGYFIPLVAGEYVIQFTATDYLGRSHTVVEKCTATLSDVPVIDKEFTMYSKLVSGVKVELPKMSAYDYSLVGQKVNAETRIIVSGYGEYASVQEEVENYQFTPTVEKFGDKIKITYRISKKGDSVNYTEKSYDVQLIEPEYSWEYLHYDEENFDLTYNAAGEKERYLKFTAKQAGNLSLEMINPVRFEYFELEVNTTAEESNYEGLQIRFTDVSDITNVAVITVKDRADDYGTIVEYKGQTGIAVNKFVSTERFVLTVKNGVLYDSLDNPLLSLQGFAPEQVRVALTMQNAEVGSALTLKKISTTYFSASYRKGELTTFRDYVSPTIVLNGKLRAEETYGSYVVIPAAKAYDDLSPCVSAFITVTAPDGTVLLNNLPADESYQILANQYGKYSVVYTAEDAAYNSATVSREVQINDYNPPVFDYNGKTEFVSEVGASVDLSKFDVYDAVDKKPTYFIYVITPNGMMHDVSDLSEYEFVSKGKHVIRHCVYDASYNYCLLDVTVEVK